MMIKTKLDHHNNDTNRSASIYLYHNTLDQDWPQLILVQQQTFQSEK